jgi:hypothetical protein
MSIPKNGALEEVDKPPHLILSNRLMPVPSIQVHHFYGTVICTFIHNFNYV